MSKKIVLKSLGCDFQWKVTSQPDSEYSWLTANTFHEVELPDVADGEPQETLSFRADGLMVKIQVIGTTETLSTTDNIEFEIIDGRPETPSGISYSLAKGDIVNETIPNNSDNPIVSVDLSYPLPNGMEIDVVDGKIVLGGSPDREFVDYTIDVTAFSKYASITFPITFNVSAPVPNVVPIDINTVFGSYFDTTYDNNGENVLEVNVLGVMPNNIHIAATPTGTVRVYGAGAQSGISEYEVEVEFIGEFGKQISIMTFTIDAEVCNIEDQAVTAIIDVELEDVVFNNTGGSAIASIVSTSQALPDGLSLSIDTVNDAIVLSGTSTVIYDTVSINVTVESEAGGQSVFAIGLTVIEGEINLLDSYNLTGIFKSYQTDINIEYAGLDVAVASTNPALPAGLSMAIDSVTKQLSLTGNTSEIQPMTSYVLTVEDIDGNSDTAVLSFEVIFKDPILTESFSPVSTYVGENSTDYIITNTGAPIVAVFSNPSLPNGLSSSVDSDGNILINGVASAETASQGYIIRATSENGEATITIIIEVTASPSVIMPSLLSYPIDDTFAYTFDDTGYAINTASFNPTLPAGMSSSISSDGKLTISGTAQAVASVTSTEVTFTSASQANQVSTFNYESIPYKPNFAQFDSIVVMRGTETFNEVSNIGADATVTVSPDLPNGLSVTVNNASDTAVISGTPTVVSSVSQYTLTYTSLKGTQTSSFFLEVVTENPVYSTPVSLSGVQGTLFLYDFINTGAANVSATSTPALPSWATLEVINDDTLRLSGTPDTDLVLTNYTINVTSANGSTDISLGLTINNNLPSIADASFVGHTYQNETITLSNTGGAVDSFTVNPALPTGLVAIVAGGTIQLDATATEVSVIDSTDYTFTLTNQYGDETTVLSYSVPLSTPTISVPSSSYQKDPNIDFSVIATLDSGFSLTSASIAPTDGTFTLSIQNNGTEILVTSTKADITALTNYTITGSNEFGESGITSFDFEILNLLPVMEDNKLLSFSPTISETQTILNSGGAVTAFTFSPPLPDGLTASIVSGNIEVTGTAAEQSSLAYTLNASNSYGAQTPDTTVNIESVLDTIVLPADLLALTQSGSTYPDYGDQLLQYNDNNLDFSKTFTVDATSADLAQVSISPIGSLTVSMGADNRSFTITSPAGATSTGMITYTVTGTSASGESDTMRIDFAIARPPTLANWSNIGTQNDAPTETEYAGTVAHGSPGDENVQMVWMDADYTPYPNFYANESSTGTVNTKANTLNTLPNAEYLEARAIAVCLTYTEYIPTFWKVV